MPRTQPSRVAEDRTGGHLSDRAIQPIPAVHGGQHRIEGGVIGQLQPRGVEVLLAQPQLVPAGPGLAAVVDNSLPQKQLRQPVPSRHQIPATVFAGAHQVPGRFLLDAGDRHRHDLAQMQQPRQMPGIAGIFSELNRS